MNHTQRFDEQVSKLPQHLKSDPAFKDFLQAVGGTFDQLEPITVPRQGSDSNVVNENLQLLINLISSLHSGILVENEHRHILFTNQQFCDIFQIPAPPASLVGYDCSGSAETSKHLIQDPEIFVERIGEILLNRAPVYGEEVVMADGEVYERNYVPIFLEDKYRGHLWEYRNVTQKKNYERSILLQKEQYHNIISNINLGLLELDLNDHIIYANPGFLKLSGYPLDEVIGKSTRDLFGDEDNSEQLEQEQKKRKQGFSNSYELKIKNKKGEVRWWNVSGAPNYDELGKSKGSIVIHLDITDKKRFGEQLQIEKNKAEASSQAKASFLANMSHEIRTPLNGIIGMIRELSYETEPEKKRRYIDNASTASEHLLSVLNNILDISKIEAGELGLEKANFKLRETLKNVKSIMSTRAREKGLFLWLDSKEIKEFVYLGDSLRIRQVILNLIGNAIKFTDNGGVYVECAIIEKKEKSHILSVTVEDTGIGMEANFVSNLFNKFSQENESVSRKFGGTGLGMAITKELVQMMGGEITVQSKKNEGTTIGIKIELPLSDGEVSEVQSGYEIPFDVLRSRVLLVEDNEFNRQVAGNTLRRYKCDVTEAVNGQEALDLISTKDFDVVLMDLQMPVMDGFEATRLIRTQLKSDVPVIALTANAFKSELDECKRIGMNDYITKPYEEEKLIGTIYKILHPKHKGKIQIAKPEIKPFEKSTALYDLSKLHKLTANNEEYFKRMVKIFIETSNNALEEVKTAFEQSDFEALYRTAHRIKPSLDHLGINSLHDTIRAIEVQAKSKQNNKVFSNNVKQLLDVLSLVVKDLEKKFSSAF